MERSTKDPKCPCNLCNSAYQHTENLDPDTPMYKITEILTIHNNDEHDNIEHQRDETACKQQVDSGLSE